MTDRRWATRMPLALMVVVLLATVGACKDEPTPLAGNVNVGQAPSSPGWGERDGAGRRSGFDNDLTNWLGQDIGFGPVSVDVITATRESYLIDHKVTLVVATYSITDERRKLVGFAGPYMVGYQGIMVRRADEGRYHTVTDLSGKTVCATRGSTSATQLYGLGFRVSVVERDVYEDCLKDLGGGLIDAVSTDQLILYGHLRDHPDFAVPHDITFGQQERYGVGLPKGDRATCEAVTASLRKFLVEGYWESFFRNNLPGVDLAGHKPDPNNLDRCDV